MLSLRFPRSAPSMQPPRTPNNLCPHSRTRQKRTTTLDPTLQDWHPPRHQDTPSGVSPRRSEVLWVRRGFSASAALPLGAGEAFGAGLSCTVQDVGPPWPQPAGCQKQPCPSAMPTKNVSRHCQIFPGRQNHPLWRTTSLAQESSRPWLVWLSGLGASLQTERPPVRFPVRARAWVAGHVPGWGHVRGNQLMF